MIWQQAGKTGLIPAWAGKTLSYGQHLADTWAHPRVAGENQIAVLRALRPGGSSPRGRGKPPKKWFT